MTKTIGYTHCPCCGLDSMDGDYCGYCEDAGCSEDERLCDLEED